MSTQLYSDLKFSSKNTQGWKYMHVKRSKIDKHVDHCIS